MRGTRLAPSVQNVTSKGSGGQVGGTRRPASSEIVAYKSTASTRASLDRTFSDCGFLCRYLKLLSSASRKGKVFPREARFAVTPGTWTIMGILVAMSKLVCLHHSPCSPNSQPVTKNESRKERK